MRSHLAVWMGLVLLLCSSLSHAQVYACKNKDGSTYYSEEKQSNQCRPFGGSDSSGSGKLSVVPAYTPSYAPDVSPSEDAGTSPTANHTDQKGSAIKAAQANLAAAKKALEEGKKVRYGNERNYAKYLERIQGLENNVQQKNQALQQIQK